MREASSLREVSWLSDAMSLRISKVERVSSEMRIVLMVDYMTDARFCRRIIASAQEVVSGILKHMEIVLESCAATDRFGNTLGSKLRGGEVIELTGDVGAGKTTLTKSLAIGMGIVDDVQSPTFTLSRTYEAPSGLTLVHYDFYRLHEPGILAAELEESLSRDDCVVVIEWSGIVQGILPDDRLTIEITPTSEQARQLSVVAGGVKSQALTEAIHI